MIAAGLVADDGELFDLLVGGPVGVADVELTEGLATLRRTVGPPCSGRTLFVLARLHSHPIGCLALADDAESPERDWVVAARTTLAGSAWRSGTRSWWSCRLTSPTSRPDASR